MVTDDPALPDPKTPVQTSPLDEAQREPWFEGPDVVTAVRIYDGDLELQLPRKAMFTIGASRDCDVPVRGRDLSAIHGMFVRKGARLRLHDQHSTNGMYVAGRRVDVVDLNPGDTFTLPPVTFLAMNEEMQRHRPILAAIVGTTFSPTPDRLLVDASRCAHHMLLTGEAGCDLDRLARSIHAVSLRRARPLVEVRELPADRAQQRELVVRASRSSLVAYLDAIRSSLDETLCSMLFSPDYHIRVIVVAQSVAQVRKLLPLESPEQLQHVWVRPLALRPGEVLDLLDGILVERGAPFRLAALTAANRDALGRHEWRDNFDGLRLAADRLIRIAQSAGWDAMDWKERSAALGVPKTTLYDWFTGLDLSAPMFDEPL